MGAAEEICKSCNDCELLHMAIRRRLLQLKPRPLRHTALMHPALEPQFCDSGSLALSLHAVCLVATKDLADVAHPASPAIVSDIHGRQVMISNRLAHLVQLADVAIRSD
jgi:hypothetical protein